MALNSQQLFLKLSSARVNLHFNSFNPKPFSRPITSCHLITPKITIKRRQNLNTNNNGPLSKHPINAAAFGFNFAPTEKNPQNNTFNFDKFLSVAESVCLISSVIVAAGFSVSFVVSGGKTIVLSELGLRALVFGAVMLVGAVVIGAWIQRRRNGSRSVNVGGLNVNSGDLVGRIAVLEEEMKSVLTAYRVLSRQLEKLGVRFRVTRRNLRDPIAETAALAQKNSEATRALAMQDDILEKEIGEMQKAMLAMQEQQQKQLELILAIGKFVKLLDNSQEADGDKHDSEIFDSAEAEEKREDVKNNSFY